VSFEELQQWMGVNEGKSREYRNYFRAKQTRRNTSVVAPPEFRRPYFVSVPFVRLACQVLNERIEMDSPRGESPEATAYLKKVWKKWGGKSFVEMAHLTAMEYGRAYLVPTGTDDPEGDPGCQVVPGRDMVHSKDPYTGQITEALRVYGRNRELRAYYTATETIYYERQPNGFVKTKSVPTANGRIAVFPLMCRDEVDNPWGRPEGKDIFTLQDSACRVSTDMAVASATIAVPQRVLFGMNASDFVKTNPDGTPQLDGNGQPIKSTPDELYMSRLLAIADPTAKLGEFAAAQLQNFTGALNSITRQAAAIMGVPQSVFGVASDANPASGDAIRQDDARLIRRAEQLTRGFEPAWVNLFEYILSTTEFGQQTVTIKWMDPSLPNLAARADAVLKLATVTVGGQPLYSWEEIRELLGDESEVIDLARDRLEKARIQQLLVDAPPGNNAPTQAAA